ncbi:hypothetical protein ACR6C2_29775 [Streptomyces sp. INA 01156]
MHDPDRAKREVLRGRLEEHWPGRVTVLDSADGAPDCDIAVNATPLGMRPADPLPFDPKSLGEGTLVADIVMEPRDTPLLLAASARGLPTHRGHHMLDHQLSLYRTFFGLRRETSAERRARRPSPGDAADASGG